MILRAAKGERGRELVGNNRGSLTCSSKGSETTSTRSSLSYHRLADALRPIEEHQAVAVGPDVKQTMRKSNRWLVRGYRKHHHRSTPGGIASVRCTHAAPATLTSGGGRKRERPLLVLLANCVRGSREKSKPRGRETRTGSNNDSRDNVTTLISEYG